MLTSTIQICSIVNTGTPHRMAEPHCKHYPSCFQVKRGCGLSLSPGVSAGRSETAPGISTDTPSRRGKRSARGEAFRKGSHRIGWCFLCCIQQVRERQPKPNTAGGSNFRNHPLCKSRPLYTGVTFKRPPPRMFFKITAVGRLSLRQSGGYGKQGKRHGKGTPTFRETLPMKVCPDKRRPSSAGTWGCCPERRRPDVAAQRGTVSRTATSKSIPLGPTLDLTLGPTLDHYLRLLSHR